MTSSVAVSTVMVYGEIIGDSAGVVFKFVNVPMYTVSGVAHPAAPVTPMLG
jgi:hypothetical protein